MEDRKDFDMDAVMKHMEASYCQQATKEKEELMLRKRGRGKEVESAKPDWNRHMAVKMERKLGEDVTSYCHCGHCAKLPYDSLERENFCCMDECMARPTTWNKNLTDILKAHKISCITEWESFNKIVIEREVLFSHLQYSSIKHREKRMKRSELDNKSLRYVACNVYTSLVHGEQLGYGVRLELPCCVRTRIIQAFPEENGQYSRFEAVNGEDHTLSDFERNMSEFCDKCELQASRVHRLPKDPERAREWVKCLKWEEKAEELMKVKNLSSFFICSGHFTKESYRNGKYDQPLLRGAVPTIVSPLVPTLTYSDHNYLEDRHPTISGSSDNEMEVDCEPMQAPLPNRNYSKQSHQTDCTWNSLGTDSTRRHGEVFTDVETIMEKKRRRRDEVASMRKLPVCGSCQYASGGRKQKG